MVSSGAPIPTEREWVEWPSPTGGEALVILSADDAYMRRYVAVAVVTALMAGMPIHVNAVAPSASVWSALLGLSRRFRGRVTLSRESPKVAAEEWKIYSAMSRFFCARRIIEVVGCPIYTVDIDSVILRPLPVPPADYGLYLRDVEDPSLAVWCATVFVAPTGVDLLAELEDWFMRKYPRIWLDDQAGLHAVHNGPLGRRGLRFVRITNRLIGFEPQPGIAIWSPKGDRKERNDRFLHVSGRCSSLLWKTVGQPAPDLEGADDAR